MGLEMVNKLCEMILREGRRKDFSLTYLKMKALLLNEELDSMIVSSGGGPLVNPYRSGCGQAGRE